MRDAVTFPPFLLDPSDRRLLRGEVPLPLPPKAFDVLTCLIANSGRLVTKRELLDAVWPGVHVGDAVLKVSIREIRQALGDDAAKPRFVETVHRQGYRFIASLSDAPRPHTSKTSAVSLRVGGMEAFSRPTDAAPGGAATSSGDAIAARFVGRAASLAALDAAAEAASRGDRQVLFAVGDAGIGKTTLIDVWLHRLERRTDVIEARASCFEHTGASEPYLPVLDAIARVCRTAKRDRVVGVLRRYAPTWLVQMPSVLDAGELASLRREIFGATPERMLREMAEAMEALAQESLLVLVLDDLHWSDRATLDLIAVLARRSEAARLVIVCAYRPVDVILTQHPLKGLRQELASRRMSRDIPIEFLSEADVAAYLAARFPTGDLPQDLARLIHARTDGNPLFMVSVADFLVDQRAIVDAGGGWSLATPVDEIAPDVPESLRHMIEKQAERLTPDEQQTLEAASAAGVTFPAAAVAAALDVDVLTIETRCDALVRRGQFLLGTGIDRLPDGALTPRYAFIHSLYQHVLYQRLTPAQRVRLHHRIAVRGEAAFGDRVGEIAGELALHFEEARDDERAVRYLRQAADNNARRGANREGIALLMRALGGLDRLTQRFGYDAHVEDRLAVMERLGFLRRTSGDMPGAVDAFAALADAAQKAGRGELHVRALLYGASAVSWYDRERCLEICAEAGRAADRLGDPLVRATTAGHAGYWNLVWKAWRLEDARACGDSVAASRESGDRSALALQLGRYAFVQTVQSAYRSAAEAAAEACELAITSGDAFDYLLAQFFRGWALLLAGEWGELTRTLDEASRLADRNGHRPWLVLVRLQRAWLCIEAGAHDLARPVCEGALEYTRSADFPFGRLMAQMLLGVSQLRAGDAAQAFDTLTDLESHLAGERLLMDWVWRMPLGLSISEATRMRGDHATARAHATRVCEAAADCGERTWLALGRCELIECAMAQDDVDEASALLRRALDNAADDAPLACRRLRETAARLAERTGDHEAASVHREAVRSVTARLASSLDASDPLRERLG